MDFELVITKAFGNLLRIGTGYLVYHLAKEGFTNAAKQESAVKEYGRALAVCAVFSMFGWALYGGHFESDDGSDAPSSYTQDFVPSRSERNEHGLSLFFTTAVLACIGVHSGRDKYPYQPRTDRPS